MMKPLGRKIVIFFAVTNFLFAGVNAYNGYYPIMVFDFVVASALVMILYKETKENGQKTSDEKRYSSAYDDSKSS